VVLCHTGTIMGYSPVSGNLAVQCFYIISGFYMAMVLTEKYDKPGGTRQFYINRALKIYPVYWLVLLLLFAWSIIVYHFHYPGTLDFYTKYSNPAVGTYLYLLLANIIIIGLDWTFLFGIDPQGHLYFTSDFNKTRPAVYNFGFNSIAWTIGVELLFYVIAPWLNRRKYYLLVILLLASIGLRLLLISWYTDRNPWNYMFFPTQVMFFIAGIFSYRLYIKFIRDKAARWLQYISYATLLFIILFYYQFFNESYTKQAVLFLSLVLLVPFAFEATKKSRLDRYLGNLSYPIYISQMLVIKLVVAKKFPKLLDIGFTALLVTVLFALLINFMIAAPIEKYRQRRLLERYNKLT
jgi:peptidoglycan/LPS O-acetylase OafA/YrhL